MEEYYLHILMCNKFLEYLMNTKQSTMRKNEKNNKTTTWRVHLNIYGKIIFMYKSCLGLIIHRTRIHTTTIHNGVLTYVKVYCKVKLSNLVKSMYHPKFLKPQHYLQRALHSQKFYQYPSRVAIWHEKLSGVLLYLDLLILQKFICWSRADN